MSTIVSVHFILYNLHYDVRCDASSNNFDVSEEETEDNKEKKTDIIQITTCLYRPSALGRAIRGMGFVSAILVYMCLIV